MHTGLRVMYRYSCWNLMEDEFSLHKFKEFHENPSGWNQTVPSTRNDGGTGGILRTGTHYPHVTCAHVMLRAQLGCERRFNVEFYGADSRFCHSAYVT